MRDTAPLRIKAIEHLEQAMAIATELSEPVLGYLIERDLDEARANQVPAIDAQRQRRPPGAPPTSV